MINTIDQTTTVLFGTDESATISVGARHRRLTLQTLATEKLIADVLTNDDIKELPKIDIDFRTTKSIDVLIHALEHIKKNFNPPPQPNYALAC